MAASDIMPSDVQPMAGTPPPAQDPSAAPMPAEDTGGEMKASLPEAILKIPAMHALLQGSPPATYAPLTSKMPEIKTLEKHADDLKKAGFAAFKSESIPDNLVLFNGLIVKPEEIMQADKAGQLDSVAVPFEQLVESFKKTAKGEDGGDAGQTPPPAAQGALPAVAGGPTPVGAPPSAGVEKRLASARVANLALGAPTSGPAPGRGRVLNTLFKPTV